MSRRYRILSAFTVVIVLIASLAGCATYDAFYDEFIDQSPETYETVKIGVFEPLSGADKAFGELEKIGIELAKEVQPYCMGKEVELIYADNQSDIYVAENAIQELISKKPAVILGSYGSVYSLVASKYIQEAQIPMITITNKNPLVTGGNPYYFRVCFVDTYQGISLAKYTVEGRQVLQAAIMRPSGDDLATAISQSYEEKMMQMLGDTNAIAATVEYRPGAQDFTEQIEKIKATGVKAVLLLATPADAIKIITQARKLDAGCIFLGTDDWNTDEFLQGIDKDAAPLAVFCTLYDTELEANSTADVFLKAYKAKYGQDAEPAPEMALGFDAYMLAVDSLNRIGTVRDGELLRESLASTFQFPGASGNITFDSKGDPMKSVAIKGIIEGEFHNIYTMEPIFQ